jgi:hypothetical protein
MDNQRKLCFETFSPSTKGKRCTIEDDSIPIKPNQPSCNYDDLSEDLWVELSSAADNHIMRCEVDILMYVHKSPTPFAERTFKE